MRPPNYDMLLKFFFFNFKPLIFFIFFFAVLDLSVDNDLLLAERQMQAMAKVLHKLICDGTYACISHRLDKKSGGFRKEN